ncbi:MAG TPA: methyltransferase domain-containing protein [Ktedonobacterales bacterium]|nr:methyltransferase domain-containing protein [Ktedonobacterales bacterium]
MSAAGETGEILALDHVQMAAPRDGEQRARDFYGGLLGLREIPKPPSLLARGGAWFALGDCALHVGLEDDFRPQRKAHPAFLVRDLAAIRARITAAGLPVIEGVPIPGRVRFETTDPFGNRLEFLQLVQPEATTDAAADAEGVAEAIRERSRAVFGRSAEAYVVSPGHAHGDDLARLVELAAPRPTDRALDVSTGGGHTALALAPHVAHVTASDLTPEMLAAARRHLTAQHVTTVDFVVADAERLPFLDATYDVVTVRIAPHHYADATRAVREMARVLVPGGRLVIVDNIAPDDRALDALVNDWERRRDSSHVRAYTTAEWQGFVAATGLRIETVETGQKTHAFQDWVARTHMPEPERERLEADILAAPEPARRHFALTTENGRLLTWSSDYMVLKAVKLEESA